MGVTAGALFQDKNLIQFNFCLVIYILAELVCEFQFFSFKRMAENETASPKELEEQETGEEPASAEAKGESDKGKTDDENEEERESKKIDQNEQQREGNHEEGDDQGNGKKIIGSADFFLP